MILVPRLSCYPEDLPKKELSVIIDTNPGTSVNMIIRPPVSRTENVESLRLFAKERLDQEKRITKSRLAEGEEFGG